MNDTELDQLLNSWEAPAPPESLRDGLRARFPRAERLGFVPPLRWAAVILLASVVLAVGMAQSSDNQWDFSPFQLWNRLYEHFLAMREPGRGVAIVARIRQSDPKVYVGGLLVAPLEYGPAGRMDVQVPGEGVYSIVLYRSMALQTADGRPTGWVQAGRVHGSVIEFQAGGKQVRIECNQPVVDRDRPVFAMRRL